MPAPSDFVQTPFNFRGHGQRRSNNSVSSAMNSLGGEPASLVHVARRKNRAKLYEIVRLQTLTTLGAARHPRLLIPDRFRSARVMCCASCRTWTNLMYCTSQLTHISSSLLHKSLVPLSRPWCLVSDCSSWPTLQPELHICPDTYADHLGPVL